MRPEGSTPAEYIENLPDDRRKAVAKLRSVINKTLPKGFQEGASDGFIHWCVPHKLYPAGYHCNPADPLPFLGIASQKNYIALYHMGIYSDPKLLKWFQDEWKKATPKRLDMGKSCIRFKNPDDIPYELIGELASRVTPQEWIGVYEKSFPRKKASRSARAQS